MINVGLIGYGYWGTKLARNFKNSEHFNLLSISDKNKNKLKEAKKEFRKIQLYQNPKHVLKDKEINLVIISTPTYTHYKLAKSALDNSKNVLVEKPMSLSLRDVKKLEKIAKLKKRKIFVDYPFLFAGSIRYLKNIIAKKKYGQVLEIESYREQAPIRYDTNVLWDLGTHDISVLNYLLNQQPSKIQVIKKNNFNLRYYDSILINMKYNKNLNVIIKNSWISPTKIRLIKIKFEKATIYCNENESLYKIRIYKKNKGNDWRKYKLEVPDIDLNEPLYIMTKYIYFSIKNNSNNLFKNKFNEKVTSLLERIEKS